MFIAYVIMNENDKISIGQTSDLGKRMKRHNGLLESKKNSFTSKNKGIWKVVYSEVFNFRKEAVNREKQLKSFRGREFLKTVIGNFSPHSSVR